MLHYYNNQAFVLMLKPCPYRQSKGSQLKCTITEELGKNFTSLTSKLICDNCSVPEIIQQVNCKNIILGKIHSTIQTQTFDASPDEYFYEEGWRTNCQVIGFDNRDDFKTKCSYKCSVFQPMHRDLSSEEIISIPNFDAPKATDRDLRQAILFILYTYHTKYPQRYRCFDVTHEFIAKSLNISVTDVVRVVFPMEDEEEVVTERYLGEPYFKHIRITSRGIQMIDEKPLFGTLDTAEVRFVESLIKIEQVNNMNNNIGGFSVGGSVGGDIRNLQGDNNRAVQGDNNQGVLGDNNQVTQQNQVGADTGESLTKEDVVKLLAQLETLIKGAELPADTKEEVIEDLSAAKKATDKEEPNKQRALERLGTVAETLDKTSKGVEAGQKIWTTAKPIIVKVASWLGAAAGSHLLGL